MNPVYYYNESYFYYLLFIKTSENIDKHNLLLAKINVKSIINYYDIKRP